MSHLRALTLEIFKHGESLKMCLFDNAQSAPTLRHYSLAPVSFSELINLSADLVSVLNRPANEDPYKLEQLRSLRKIGKLFWDHLFSRPVKEKLKNLPPCILTLCLDEELIYLPWELIFDGEDFLCLKFSLGRLVRSKGDLAMLQYRDLREGLRMLILADPVSDLKSAYAEGLNIKNQFMHKTRKVSIDFKSSNIDKNYVRKNICDYDIVHFAGHCEFDKKGFQKSGWVLKDGLFKTEDILKMGQGCSMPALVFSNACHSAQANDRLLDPEYQTTSYGMASAFLYSGVRHYIGAIRKIEDSPSLVFAKHFYARLISGSSVGESLQLSRLKLVREFGLEGLHWVNYLLYGDPGFVFFSPQYRREYKHRTGIFYKKFGFRSALALFIILAIFGAVYLAPRINPGKLYLFINSQIEYRKGNNRSAIELGERLVNKDQNFLAVYPIIANAYQRVGNRDKALRFYFDYMLKSEKLNNKQHLVQAYTKLAWFYHLDGQYEKARQLYEKAIGLSRRINDKSSEALALRKLAVWHIDKGNFEEAFNLLTKSMSINLERQRNFENARNLACDYFDLGLVFMNKDDYPAGKEFYEKSRRIFERLKLKNELSDCYFNLGEIYMFEKEYNKALEYYFKGLDTDREQGNKVNLACGYNMVGELYVEIDDLAKAEEYFKKSAELAQEIDSRMDLANAHYNLGLLYKKQRRKNMARQHWRKAQEIYRSADYDKYQEIREELLGLDNI